MAAKKLSPVAAKLREKALSYPATTESFPWGEHAFKVKGKTFVFMRDDEAAEDPLRVHRRELQGRRVEDGAARAAVSSPGML